MTAAVPGKYRLFGRPLYGLSVTVMALSATCGLYLGGAFGDALRQTHGTVGQVVAVGLGGLFGLLGGVGWCAAMTRRSNRPGWLSLEGTGCLLCSAGHAAVPTVLYASLIGHFGPGNLQVPHEMLAILLVGTLVWGLVPGIIFGEIWKGTVRRHEARLNATFHKSRRCSSAENTQ